MVVVVEAEASGGSGTTHRLRRLQGNLVDRFRHRLHRPRGERLLEGRVRHAQKVGGGAERGRVADGARVVVGGAEGDVAQVEDGGDGAVQPLLVLGGQRDRAERERDLEGREAVGMKVEEVEEVVVVVEGDVCATPPDASPCRRWRRR